MKKGRIFTLLKIIQQLLGGLQRLQAKTLDKPSEEITYYTSCMQGVCILW